MMIFKVASPPGVKSRLISRWALRICGANNFELARSVLCSFLSHQQARSLSKVGSTIRRQHLLPESAGYCEREVADISEVSADWTRAFMVSSQPDKSAPNTETLRPVSSSCWVIPAESVSGLALACCYLSVNKHAGLARLSRVPPVRQPRFNSKLLASPRRQLRFAAIAFHACTAKSANTPEVSATTLQAHKPRRIQITALGTHHYSGERPPVHSSGQRACGTKLRYSSATAIFCTNATPRCQTDLTKPQGFIQIIRALSPVPGPAFWDSVRREASPACRLSLPVKVTDTKNQRGLACPCRFFSFFLFFFCVFFFFFRFFFLCFFFVLFFFFNSFFEQAKLDSKRVFQHQHFCIRGLIKEQAVTTEDPVHPPGLLLPPTHYSSTRLCAVSRKPDGKNTGVSPLRS